MTQPPSWRRTGNKFITNWWFYYCWRWWW